MSTKQGYLKERGTNNPFAPKTIDTLVKDSARNQALSASLANMVERNALGFPVFNTTTAYSEGDKVFYDRRLWTTKAGGHAAGAWSDNDFDEFTFKEYLDAVASTKANTDGFYESMGVGTAVNLAGQIERTNDKTYRTSGGEEDIATGTARIEKVSGNTVVWNQLCKQQHNTDTVNGVTFTKNSNGSYTVNGEATSNGYFFVDNNIGFTQVKGHVYFVSGAKENLMLKGNNTGGISENVYERYITTCTGNTTEQKLAYKFENGAVFDNVISYPMLFDLTLIYGEEVANSMTANQEWGISKFEDDYKQWFGKPLTYEPYNEGELIPVKMTGLKTTGFNQWDEEWEVGALMVDPLSPIIGDKIVDITCIRSKNYIPIFPNTTYYAKGTTSIRFCFYDANKVFVSTQGASTTTNTTFVTPKNAKYCLWYTRCTPTTYNNDICINLHWSGTKDGTYEPYEEHTLPFDVTTLQGKLNGQGELVTPFADGLKKAGSVQDEIYYVGKKVFGVKRVGSVDLGSGNYNIGANSQGIVGFSKNLADSYSVVDRNKYACAKFRWGGSYHYSTTQSYDGTLSTTSGGTSLAIVPYQEYATVADFKTAMNGVMLYYELATPLVYELEDVELPARFKVNDLGTEEQLHAEGVNSAPAILSVLYGVNAVDVLRRLPQGYVTIGADNNNNADTTMRKLLNALSTAMGGTWAITVDENDPTDFDFTFTPNSTPEETNNNTEGE